MPMKIVYKPAASNQKKTPDKTAPLPFIDKLSLTITPGSSTEAHALFNLIKEALGNPTLLAKDPQVFIKGYTSRRIVTDGMDPKHWPVFQFKADNKGQLAQKIRLEFNPRKLGKAGIDDLKIALLELIGGWDPVLYQGKITRIDVGVDIPEMRLDDFLFLAPHPTQIMRFNVNGTVESVTHGGKKSNQTLVYSPPKKRKSKGQPWSGPPTIRIEKRWRKQPPIKSMTELGQLQNPFSDFVLTYNPPPEPPSKSPWMWATFLDSVHVRGVRSALQMIPPLRRKQYKAHFKQHPHPKWDPVAIWAQWPDAVALSQLTVPGP